ncbi:MAG: hypothetical protein KY434_02600 [Actinobacteria bacterium]|nr:hypothetical protein [Actinomycetota bacterium]
MTEAGAWDTWDGRGLRDYLAVVRRQRWVVAGVGLLGVLLVVLALLLAPDRYESSVRVLAGPAARGPQEDSTPVSDLVNVATERQVLSSRAVGARVKRVIGYRGSVEELLEQLSVEAPADTEILELSFRAGDPTRARQGAQAFGEAYLAYRQRLAQAATEAQVRGLERKLLRRGRALDRAEAALRRSGAASDTARARGRVDLLESQVEGLQLELSLLRTLGGDAGTIVGPASPPEPDPLIPLLPGLVAALLSGLIAGLAAGFARDRLDDRLREPADLPAVAGAPLLGTIAAPRGRRRDRGTSHDAALAEAYRRLRAAVLATVADGGHKAVMVASASHGEQAGVVALNLAQVLARGGRRVLLVSLDDEPADRPGRPRTGTGPGLGEVLSGEVDLLSAAVADEGTPGLHTLSAGRWGDHPADQLQSPRMHETLGQARRLFDDVLVATPPILSSADAVAVATSVDAVVLVARARRSTATSVRAAVDGLGLVGAGVHGAVLCVGDVMPEGPPGRGGAVSPDGLRPAGARA